MSDTPNGPIEGARYGHTNLIARDWRRLATWYERLFGCVPVPPERDYAGPDLSRGTAIPDAALKGVLAEGGSPVGDVVTLTTADGRRVTWCYVTDPEGNVVELQSWAPPA